MVPRTNESMTPNYFNAIPLAAEPTNFVLTASEKKIITGLEYFGYPGKVSVSRDYKVLEHKSLKRVKKFILSKVKQYTEDILQIRNQVCMTQSWSTINKKGSSHHEHTHPNAFLSLVYYVDCDEKSGDLTFITERSSIQQGYNFNYSVIKHNVFNASGWTFQTKPGFICVFPGHVRHFSSTHDGDRDRIIIGANFFVEGDIGQLDNTDMMRLDVN